jgi:hypothetical protein
MQILAIIVPLFWDLWTTNYAEGDPLRFTQNQQETIGSWIDACANDIPSHFGTAPSNINKNRNSQYKLFEWAAFLQWFSLPFLMTLQAPQEVIAHWGLLVLSTQLVLDHNGISEKNLKSVEKLLNRFVVDFERIYVRNKLELSGRCKLYLFQLLHITEIIRANGSLRVGSQFSMERTIGFYKRLIRSFKEPFSNLANRIVVQELLATLSLLYPELDNSLIEYNIQTAVSQQKIHVTEPEAEALISLRKNRTFTRLDCEEENLVLGLLLSCLEANAAIDTDQDSETLCKQIRGWPRYGKVLLPNGQKIRSAENERLQHRSLRHACRVQVRLTFELPSENTILTQLPNHTLVLQKSQR